MFFEHTSRREIENTFAMPWCWSHFLEETDQCPKGPDLFPQISSLSRPICWPHNTWQLVCIIPLQTGGIEFDGLKILGSILQGTLHDLSFVSFLFSISVYFYAKRGFLKQVCVAIVVGSDNGWRFWCFWWSLTWSVLWPCLVMATTRPRLLDGSSTSRRLIMKKWIFFWSFEGHPDIFRCFFPLCITRWTPCQVLLMGIFRALLLSFSFALAVKLGLGLWNCGTQGPEAHGQRGLGGCSRSSSVGCRIC